MAQLLGNRKVELLGNSSRCHDSMDLHGNKVRRHSNSLLHHNKVLPRRRHGNRICCDNNNHLDNRSHGDRSHGVDHSATHCGLLQQQECVGTAHARMKDGAGDGDVMTRIF